MSSVLPLQDHPEMLEDFCKLLPKVELHAHINGSCSEDTLAKLLKLKKSRQPDYQPSAPLDFGKKKVTLDQCFKEFKVIHELCDSDEAAFIVTSDVVHEFAADNVRYLELRTTPRDVPATRMTKASYIDSVLAAIRNATASESVNIVVRLLLAIDRRMTMSDIEEVLKLAQFHASQTGGLVVGLDLSGDPKAGNAQSFLPIFDEAKKTGLRLALHIAESAESLTEAASLLSANPDRIGHGTFLQPDLAGSSDLADQVIASKTPIELCLTSNVLTKTVADYSDHHFDFWYNRKHPVCICTDDKGVFATSLSKEFAIAARTFGLSKQQLWKLSHDSIDFIFAGDAVKEELRRTWNELAPTCLGL